MNGDIFNEKSISSKDYVDQSLFELRNMILGLEKCENNFDAHTLQNLAFNEIAQSANIFLLGVTIPKVKHFHESLNTLEFCLKFKSVL